MAEPDYQKFISRADAPIPDRDRLVGRILVAVGLARRRREFTRAAGWGVVLAASLAFLAASAVSVWGQLLHSGFFVFLSLPFTDNAALSSGIPSVALSLLEAFPAFPFAVVLLCLFISIVALARTARHALPLTRAPFASYTR